MGRATPAVISFLSSVKRNLGLSARELNSPWNNENQPPFQEVINVPVTGLRFVKFYNVNGSRCRTWQREMLYAESTARDHNTGMLSFKTISRHRCYECCEILISGNFRSADSAILQVLYLGIDTVNVSSFKLRNWFTLCIEDNKEQSTLNGTWFFEFFKNILTFESLTNDTVESILWKIIDILTYHWMKINWFCKKVFDLRSWEYILHLMADVML